MMGLGKSLFQALGSTRNAWGTEKMCKQLPLTIGPGNLLCFDRKNFNLSCTPGLIMESNLKLGIFCFLSSCVMFPQHSGFERFYNFVFNNIF